MPRPTCPCSSKPPGERRWPARPRKTASARRPRQRRKRASGKNARRKRNVARRPRRTSARRRVPWAVPLHPAWPPGLTAARLELIAARPTLIADRPTLIADRPTLIAARPTLIADRPTLIADHRPLAPAATPGGARRESKTSHPRRKPNRLHRRVPRPTIGSPRPSGSPTSTWADSSTASRSMTAGRRSPWRISRRRRPRPPGSWATDESTSTTPPIPSATDSNGSCRRFATKSPNWPPICISSRPMSSCTRGVRNFNSWSAEFLPIHRAGTKPTRKPAWRTSPGGSTC